jgi:hypothetical protein
MSEFSQTTNTTIEDVGGGSSDCTMSPSKDDFHLHTTYLDHLETLLSTNTGGATSQWSYTESVSAKHQVLSDTSERGTTPKSKKEHPVNNYNNNKSISKSSQKRFQPNKYHFHEIPTLYQPMFEFFQYHDVTDILETITSKLKPGHPQRDQINEKTQQLLKSIYCTYQSQYKNQNSSYRQQSFKRKSTNSPVKGSSVMTRYSLDEDMNHVMTEDIQKKILIEDITSSISLLFDTISIQVKDFQQRLSSTGSDKPPCIVNPDLMCTSFEGSFPSHEDERHHMVLSNLDLALQLLREIIDKKLLNFQELISFDNTLEIQQTFDNILLGLNGSPNKKKVMDRNNSEDSFLEIITRLIYGLRFLSLGLSFSSLMKNIYLINYLFHEARYQFIAICCLSVSTYDEKQYWMKIVDLYEGKRSDGHSLLFINHMLYLASKWKPSTHSDIEKSNAMVRMWCKYNDILENMVASVWDQLCQLMRKNSNSPRKGMKIIGGFDESYQQDEIVIKAWNQWNQAAILYNQSIAQFQCLLDLQSTIWSVDSTDVQGSPIRDAMNAFERCALALEDNADGLLDENKIKTKVSSLLAESYRFAGQCYLHADEDLTTISSLENDVNDRITHPREKGFLQQRLNVVLRAAGIFMEKASLLMTSSGKLWIEDDLRSPVNRSSVDNGYPVKNNGNHDIYFLGKAATSLISAYKCLVDCSASLMESMNTVQTTFIPHAVSPSDVARCYHKAAKAFIYCSEALMSGRYSDAKMFKLAGMYLAGYDSEGNQLKKLIYDSATMVYQRCREIQGLSQNGIGMHVANPSSPNRGNLNQEFVELRWKVWYYYGYLLEKTGQWYLDRCVHQAIVGDNALDNPDHSFESNPYEIWLQIMVGGRTGKDGLINCLQHVISSANQQLPFMSLCHDAWKHLIESTLSMLELWLSKIGRSAANQLDTQRDIGSPIHGDSRYNKFDFDSPRKDNVRSMNIHELRHRYSEYGMHGVDIKPDDDAGQDYALGLLVQQQTQILLTNDDSSLEETSDRFFFNCNSIEAGRGFDFCNVREILINLEECIAKYSIIPLGYSTSAPATSSVPMTGFKAMKDIVDITLDLSYDMIEFSKHVMLQFLHDHDMTGNYHDGSNDLSGQQQHYPSPFHNIKITSKNIRKRLSYKIEAEYRLLYACKRIQFIQQEFFEYDSHLVSQWLDCWQSTKRCAQQEISCIDLHQKEYAKRFHDLSLLYGGSCLMTFINMNCLVRYTSRGSLDDALDADKFGAGYFFDQYFWLAVNCSAPTNIEVGSDGKLTMSHLLQQAQDCLRQAKEDEIQLNAEIDADLDM